MTFTETPPDVNFSMRRFVSKSGKWELGLTPVLFGARVRFGKVGSNCVELDYCAGATRLRHAKLLVTVKTILESMPENATYEDLRQINWPRQDIKPVFLDPVCWPKLRKLALRQKRLA